MTEVPSTATSPRETNKALLKAAFDAAEKGDARLYWGLMADDVTFTVIGTTAWSRTFTGKAQVSEKLLTPLREQLEGYNKVSAQRFIGDADVVVVEGRGNNRTKAGQAYENRYAWVFRMKDGKVHAIKEYADTQLQARVLTGPPA